MMIKGGGIMLYNIKVYNSGKCLICDENVEAADENKALREVADEVPFNVGDTICIDDVE